MSGSKRNFTRLAILASVSSVVLAACGGGGGSVTPPPVTATPPPPPPAATSETYVTVTGAIDGFGSVIVNGTRYDTDSANVKVDGEDADLSDLSVGQIVSLRARRNGDGELPTALRVRYEEVLEGPVESVAADGRSLVILGQTVFLTDSTVFEDDLDPETIIVDDLLEVSGSFNAEGDIIASYVEISDEVDGDYEVHGTVGGLNETDQTFRVRGLRIGYGSAELSDFEDGNTLSNGDKVEVEGSVFLNDGTLVATRVEFEGDDLEELEGDEADEADEEEAEIEGFITAFIDSTDFEVNGQRVVTTAQTEFERCTADGLALDVEVEVEGLYDENDVLVAEKVKCEVESNIFITARVDDVNEAEGTVSLLGVTVNVDMNTRFQDKSNARVREFGLDDIAVDDILRVQAFEVEGADGEVLVAKKIRRERANKFDGPEIKGDVTDIGDDFLRVAGVDVRLTDETEFEIDEDEVSRDVFLDNLLAGDRLKVEGFVDEDGNFVATEIEREDDDDDDDGTDDDDDKDDDDD